MAVVGVGLGSSDCNADTILAITDNTVSTSASLGPSNVLASIESGTMALMSAKNHSTSWTIVVICITHSLCCTVLMKARQLPVILFQTLQTLVQVSLQKPLALPGLLRSHRLYHAMR